MRQIGEVEREGKVAEAIQPILFLTLGGISDGFKEPSLRNIIRLKGKF